MVRGPEAQTTRLCRARSGRVALGGDAKDEFVASHSATGVPTTGRDSMADGRDTLCPITVRPDTHCHRPVGEEGEAHSRRRRRQRPDRPGTRPPTAASLAPNASRRHWKSADIRQRQVSMLRPCCLGRVLGRLEFAMLARWTRPCVRSARNDAGTLQLPDQEAGRPANAMGGAAARIGHDSSTCPEPRTPDHDDHSSYT